MEFALATSTALRTTLAISLLSAIATDRGRFRKRSARAVTGVLIRPHPATFTRNRSNSEPAHYLDRVRTVGRKLDGTRLTPLS
jgi:hypothetical protein